MLLEYESEYGQRREIGQPQTFEEAARMCRNFLESVPMRIYYWEWQLGDDMWILDFGSYRSFIILSQLKDGLSQEFENFYSKGEKDGNV